MYHTHACVHMYIYFFCFFLSLPFGDGDAASFPALPMSPGLGQRPGLGAPVRKGAAGGKAIGGGARAPGERGFGGAGGSGWAAVLHSRELEGCGCGRLGVPGWVAANQGFELLCGTVEDFVDSF